MTVIKWMVLNSLVLKGVLLSLRQFLATESHLKMMKNIFFPLLKALFALEVSILLWIFGYVQKQLDRLAKVNFKIYGVANWIRNNNNMHIVRYLKK